MCCKCRKRRRKCCSQVLNQPPIVTVTVINIISDGKEKTGTDVTINIDRNDDANRTKLLSKL